MYAFWGGRLIEASHVVMHLWKTLLHVILSTALSHRPKTEAQGWVVELRRGQIRKWVDVVGKTGGGITTELISHSF